MSSLSVDDPTRHLLEKMPVKNDVMMINRCDNKKVDLLFRAGTLEPSTTTRVALEINRCDNKNVDLLLRAGALEPSTRTRVALESHFCKTLNLTLRLDHLQFGAYLSAKYFKIENAIGDLILEQVLKLMNVLRG